MVRGERRILGETGGDETGWRPVDGGAWLFVGKCFADERGSSFETIDLSTSPAELEPFAAVQENLVLTEHAGTARGLHYQVGSSAQAKVVTVVRGAAQLFWLPLDQEAARPCVHSIILQAAAPSLYTPGNCAHGVLALEPDTAFLLKMSVAVSLKDRAEISLLARDLSIDFAVPIRTDLLSVRDRNAPSWTNRRT